MDKLLWHIEKKMFATLISYDWINHHKGDKILYYNVMLSNGAMVREPDFKFCTHKEIMTNGN